MQYKTAECHQNLTLHFENAPTPCMKNRRFSQTYSLGSLRTVEDGLDGTAPEPPKGGTPNLRLRISVGFFRHALGCRHCRRLREITHFIGVMRRLALFEGCRFRQ